MTLHPEKTRVVDATREGGFTGVLTFMAGLRMVAAMNAKALIRLVSVIVVIAMSAGRLWAAGNAEEEAQKAAEKWLALTDAGKSVESWEISAGYFKKAVPKEKWEASLEAVRKPLGELVSRKLKSAKYAKTLPGAPDGEYVVLKFDTSFANKKVAVETVTPMLDKDGKWRVSGYFVN